MKTDIQIAQEAEMLHIRELQQRLELKRKTLSFTASIRQNYRMN